VSARRIPVGNRSEEGLRADAVAQDQPAEPTPSIGTMPLACHAGGAASKASMPAASIIEG
jgi:hypothetical protein